MTSYVVIYGNPERGQPDAAVAVIVAEGASYRTVGADDWITTIQDIATGRPDDYTDADLLAYLTRALWFNRTGPHVRFDSPLDEAADVIERLYFAKS